ncbi:hypothetical protein QCA50_020087 [Cerrena zonata]|uniref:Uncharacterized protein n=1 Tax=Cerrena zonata TaxID=2478898 RepID=A0AAW0FDZ9_9APHY
MCFSTPMLHPLSPHVRNVSSVAKTQSVSPLKTVASLTTPPTTNQNKRDPNSSHLDKTVECTERDDGSHLATEAENRMTDIDLNTIGRDVARRIMSEEHKLLGFRPPHNSFAAKAQAAAAKHPIVKNAQVLPMAQLKQAAKADAERILTQQVLKLQAINLGTENQTGRVDSVTNSGIAEELNLVTGDTESSLSCFRAPKNTKHPKNASKDRLYTDGDASKSLSSGQNASPTMEDAIKPPMSRTETTDSIEIICNILG